MKRHLITLSVFLLVAGALYSVGEFFAPGGITIGSGGPLNAASATYTRLKTGTLAARPANCTAGDTYFVTDAAAGQNWTGCSTTGAPGTWSTLGDGTGAGGGTVNSATTGWEFPFYIPGQFDNAATGAVNALAYRGVVIEKTYDSQWQYRNVQVDVTTAAASTGIAVCVYATDNTTVVAKAVFDSGTTGIKNVAYDSGTQVSAGVWTRPAGTYRYLVFSDSTTVATATTSGAAASSNRLFNLTTRRAWRAGAAGGSGTGTGLACVADLATTLAGAPTAVNVSPLLVMNN